MGCRGKAVPEGAAFPLLREVNMKEKAIVAEGLAAYAIERRFGFERHRPDGAPSWEAVRAMWISTVLGEMDDMSSGRSLLLDLYHQRMKEAEGISAAEPAPLQLQQDTIKGLSEYVSALSRMAGDNRHEIFAVRELLDDMGSHLPWAGSSDIQSKVIDQANRELRRMTAQQPIRFTRLFLGWERGPAGSTFLPGLVTQADEILASDFFDEMRWRHGYDKWPALCVAYTGGGRGHYLPITPAWCAPCWNSATSGSAMSLPAPSWWRGRRWTSPWFLKSTSCSPTALIIRATSAAF